MKVFSRSVTGRGNRLCKKCGGHIWAEEAFVDAKQVPRWRNLWAGTCRAECPAGEHLHIIHECHHCNAKSWRAESCDDAEGDA